MKTVSNLAELRRMALASGAEVVGNGVHFNAARQQVKAVPKPPAAPPAPAAIAPAPPPASAPGLTREQVEQLLAHHNRTVTEQLTAVLRELRAAPTVPPRAEPRQWDFEITYDADHAITNITAKAKP